MKFFDMLCSRYSDGLNLLDNFISCGQLCRFIDSFYDYINETQAWEFWLHKETGKTWGDFKLSVLPQNIDADKLKKSSEIIEKDLMRGGIWLNGTI